jgi:hypothetical protein
MAQLKKEIEEFAGRVQGIVDRHYAESFVNLPVPTITVKFGRKYAKLIREDSTGALGRTQKFVYGFVDAHTGDIYKAATWAAPAKHVRGNIFNDDGGMNSCTPNGIVYL